MYFLNFEQFQIKWNEVDLKMMEKTFCLVNGILNIIRSKIVSKHQNFTKFLLTVSKGITLTLSIDVGNDTTGWINPIWNKISKQSTIIYFWL